MTLSVHKQVIDKDTLALYQAVVDNPKVPMTLRVGMAGPRNLSSAQYHASSQHVLAVLTHISAELVHLIETSPIAQHLYDLKQHPLPTLRLTTSLAIGADRLAIDEGVTACEHIKSHIEYAAILPFLVEECKTGLHETTRSDEENEQDWIDLQACIEKITQQSKPRLIELNGDISSPQSKDTAYFRCTEYLVENIDLLIVVTTPETQSPNHSLAQHTAGTATTLRLAKEAGRPIIEIACCDDDAEPNVIVHSAKRFGRDEEPEVFSNECIKHLLVRLVLFGDLFKGDDSLLAANNDLKASNNEKLAIQKLVTDGLSQHIEDKKYLSTQACTTDFDHQSPIYTKFSSFEKFMGYEIFDRFKKALINKTQVNMITASMTRADHIKVCDTMQQPDNPKEAHSWFAYFSRSDVLSIRFASIHRSTYLLIYWLAACALIFAAMALTFQEIKPLVLALIIAEIITLGLIFVLYKKDHHNHQKWLQNRCLAEAIRPNIYLSQFGRCFSFFNIRSSDEFMYREVMGHNQSGAQWVCIQAELINRHIGFAHCKYSANYLGKSTAFLQSTWVSGQISYHLSNAAKMQDLGKRFSIITHILFFSTCLAITLKLLLFASKTFIWPEPLATHNIFILIYRVTALTTAVFPILGTAMFAIRNHSEFDISAQRSLTMLAFFNSMYRAISSKEGNTNNKLDAQIDRLTKVSAQEVSDWLEIYEVKESEPG